MSTAVAAPAEQRTVLRGISWETYERLLDERGEASVPRLTYDRGVLEIMSPGKKHETLDRRVSALVLVVGEEWGIAVTDLGHLTFKNSAWDRGFEPDGCFWVGGAAEEILVREEYEPDHDPAPDVVLEVDITRDSMRKHALFEQFGVGELWRHDGERLTILVLGPQGYTPTDVSRAFPLLTADALTELLAARQGMSSLEWLPHVRARARAAAERG